MALSLYEYAGRVYQFADGDVPAGAVPFESEGEPDPEGESEGVAKRSRRKSE